MAKNFYTELFSIYAINRNHSNIHNIRSKIRRCLEAEYPGKTWDELSLFHQKHFSLVTMRKYLLEQTNQKDKANRNLQKEDDLFFNGIKLLSDHNKNVDKLFKMYYDSNAPIEEQEKSYQDYCKDLSSMFPTENIPTFDEWKANPLRLYDIQQSIIDENLLALQNSEYISKNSVSQNSIDHIVVECIRKIVEDKLGVTIDIDGIADCLITTQDIKLTESMYLESDDELLTEADKEILSKVKTSDNTLESLIANKTKIPCGDKMHNKELLYALHRLETLDFIKPKSKSSI